MEHDWDFPTDYCISCGAGRCEIMDNLRCEECSAAPNVVGISHILSRRQFNRDLGAHMGYVRER